MASIPAISLIGSRRSRTSPCPGTDASGDRTGSPCCRCTGTRGCVGAGGGPVMAEPQPAQVAPVQTIADLDESSPGIDPLAVAMPAATVRTERNVQVEGALKHTSYLNRTFTFENFVEGNPNQLAIRAAAWQVADNSSTATTHCSFMVVSAWAKPT